MRTLLCLFMGLLAIGSQAQSQKELNSQLEEVTVYLSGAQLSRTGEMMLPAGESILIAKGLSPHLDPASLQVTGQGNFTLLSINHELNYGDGEAFTEKEERLRTKQKELENTKHEREADLEVVMGQMAFIESNQKLEGNYATVENWQKALAFYQETYRKLKYQRLELDQTIDSIEMELLRIEQQIFKVRPSDPSHSWVRIHVQADAATRATFALKYFVAEAGWSPRYDIRMEGVDKPLNLEYKATVHQNTGENWENIALTLTNYDPNRSGQKPNLSPWVLGRPQARSAQTGEAGVVSGYVYDQTGTALPGVNVSVHGTSIGVTTGIDGKFRIQIPRDKPTCMLNFSYVGFKMQQRTVQGGEFLTLYMEEAGVQLEEVSVTAFGFSDRRAAGVQGGRRNSRSQTGFATAEEDDAEPMANTATVSVAEVSNAVRLVIEEPYSLASGQEPLSVDLNRYALETEYEYVAVPKLDPEAFLVARITDWQQYPLMEGMANLFVEGTYQGETLFDPRSQQDTLALSLGRDRSVQVSRTQITENLRPRYLATRREEVRAYELVVLNQKNTPIRVVVQDQIPLSPREDIDVITETLSGGTLQPETGIVSWTLEIPARQQKKLRLDYKVRLPKWSPIIVN